MSLVLPRVHVDRRARRITESEEGVLGKQSRSALLNLDWDLARRTEVVGARIVPLGREGWAVGHGVEDGTVWRIVSHEAATALGNPAWLWTDLEWFTTSRTFGTPPRKANLKKALRQAARLNRSTGLTNALVGAIVAHLRKPDRRPLAVVGTPDQLATGASKWLALAVLSCIPPQLGLPLRIGCNEPLPDPKFLDFVTSSEVPKGFDIIHMSSPPEEIGLDLVAWYVRRRLLDGEPELVEAIAPLWDESADDPWGHCVLDQVIRGGLTGIGIDKRTLVEDLPIAVRLIAVRLKGGAPLGGRLANELAAVTWKAAEPELWRMIAERTDKERMRAFSAWLLNAHRYPPTEALLEAIAAVRPTGVQTAGWLAGLMRWMATGEVGTAAPRLIAKTLEEDSATLEPASRASVFLELVIRLVEDDQPIDAVSMLFGPTGRAMAEAGAGSALAQAWLLLPDAHHTESHLADLLTLVGRGEDSGRAAAFLYQALRAQGNTELSELALGLWAAHRGRVPPVGPDALMETLLGKPDAELWVQAAAENADHHHLPLVLVPVISHRQPQLWAVAEEAFATGHNLLPGDRFVAMTAFLPEGLSVLERRAVETLEQSLPATPFPNQAMAEAASLFAEGSEASPVWMWAAVAAALPDQFDEATIDATVHAYCGQPPRRIDDRQLALLIARRLGFANEWSAMDHARWLVRLLLAPDGDASGHNVALALAMLESMLKRADGMQRVITLAKALFDLPPDHAALRSFIEIVLPRLWEGGPPPAFMRAVQVDRQPTEIRSAWRQTFGSL